MLPVLQGLKFGTEVQRKAGAKKSGNGGGLAFPANNQTLVYDADGDLTFDGVWNYQWDGENRLISMNMTNIAGLSANAQGLATNRLRLDFGYDYLGRRVQKTVSVWNTTTSGFQTSTANSFVYDGWNLVAVLDPQSSVLQSFVWGNDLSGTMTKAGGVGGLLMAVVSGTNCFAGYDGNGNITAFINAMDKSVSARYEYSPYGQLIREAGLLAVPIPFRFSTRFWDDESGLVYYGDRYYSPGLGKWAGRDSSQEKSGLNIYAFNFNDTNDRFDTIGDTSADNISLGQGYSGRVDTFNTEGDASFELHIYDNGGNEVGVVGPEGWINKHGFTGPPELPDDVMRVIKGVAVNTARDAGMISKGASIRNWLWNGTMGAINRSGRIGGAIVGILAIQAAVQGGLQAAEDAKDYARDARNGDSAWVDLDAACVAADVVNATGNYYMGYEALDILLSN